MADRRSVAITAAAPSGPALVACPRVSLTRTNRSYREPDLDASPSDRALSTLVALGVVSGITRSPTVAWSQRSSGSFFLTTMPTMRSIFSPTPGGKVIVAPDAPPMLVRLAMPSPAPLMPPEELVPWGGGDHSSAPSNTHPQWSCRPSPRPSHLILTTRVPSG